MSQPTFQETQLAFTAHLRDPEHVPAPRDVEKRRIAIYSELIYNNIESFISGGFPILRSLHNDADWYALVRDFIRSHQAHTPYFLEIGQEFLTYLQNTRRNPLDPPFMVELAHYEWVELALDISTETLPEGMPEPTPADDWLAAQPLVSPLAWNLSYHYPVHRIGPTWQPTEPPQLPTFLVVYRNRQDQVRFMESNAATSRLLTLLADAAQPLTGRDALLQLATEMQAPDTTAFIQFGNQLLHTLAGLDILCGHRA